MGKSLVRSDSWNATVVDVSVDSTTVTSKPARLGGIFINTALSAHALPIIDGATTIFTIPASATAGTFYNFIGTKFNTSLIVDPNDAATGNITVLWDPM
jgi:hypothetical protein